MIEEDIRNIKGCLADVYLIVEKFDDKLDKLLTQQQAVKRDKSKAERIKTRLQEVRKDGR